MARPSQQLDQALLRSGRALYPSHGCARLSQRLVAEHAGVQPGMVHYHFGSKDGFLRALLQQLYDELFADLLAGASEPGPPLQRLRAALLMLAGFAHRQRPLLLRLVADAAGGQAVVQDFLRDNVPRHMALLIGLLQDARGQGSLADGETPLAAAVFLMGAVVAPMLVVPAIAALDPALPGWPAGSLREAVDRQVTCDAAIAQRVDLALAAVSGAAPRSPS